MRKSTAHGRKLARQPAGFNGAEWINAISRCRPFTDELIPGAIGTTAADAEQSIADVEAAYNALTTNKTLPNDARDFNLLAHALGVSEMRAEADGSAAALALLPTIAAGNATLGKIKARREKWGKWEVLPAESEVIFDALAGYENILVRSSPAQMGQAIYKRLAWLQRRDADRLAAVE
jgi:hypothetical protein